MELYTDNQCSGCGLCLSVCPNNAISFVENSEGFLNPSIDQDKCINCGLCRKICTFNRKPESETKPLLSFAVKANNEKTRQKSSSGGVFPLLAEHIINDCGGVVFGAAYVPDQHMKVAHIRIDSTVDINLLQGSKYVQSDVCNVYKMVEEDLRNDKSVLFSGTPCQISACKEYLRQKKVNTNNFITVDFVCHGVPSPKLWKEYIDILEKKTKKKVIDFDFRYKDENCVWGEINTCAKYEDDIEVNTPLVRAFINMYFSNVITRTSCTNCPYASIFRQSDFTLADCWGIEKIIPQFADKLGVSLVLVNTETAIKIFESIRGNMIFRPIDAEKLHQPHLKEPCKPSPLRSKFWKTYSKYGILKVMKKYTKFGLINRIKSSFIKIAVKIYHIGRNTKKQRMAEKSVSEKF